MHISPTLRLVVAVLALVLLPAGTASAAPLAMTATGTTSPGIPLLGCAQQFTVRFSGTVVSAPGATIGTVDFDGRSTACTSLLADAGEGWFFGAYNGPATYVRTATVMSFAGVGFSFLCDWTPTSLHPTTSYTLACTSGTSANR